MSDGWCCRNLTFINSSVTFLGIPYSKCPLLRMRGMHCLKTLIRRVRVSANRKQMYVPVTNLNKQNIHSDAVIIGTHTRHGTRLPMTRFGFPNFSLCTQDKPFSQRDRSHSLTQMCQNMVRSVVVLANRAEILY